MWERDDAGLRVRDNRSDFRNEENLLSALAAPTTLQGVSEPLVVGYP